MTPDELRPVGSGFWYDYGPDGASTDPSARRIFYQVVSHTRVCRFLGDEQGDWVEELKPIKIQKAPLLEWCITGGYRYGEWEDADDPR